MKQVIEKSGVLRARRTTADDLEFVIFAERLPENAQYVGQWTHQQHLDALLVKDVLHLIIEEGSTQQPVGYVIMAGLENPHHNVEFKRLVITKKGQGFGRATLRLAKKIAFEQLDAHRLWLDVRERNLLAQGLYKSEGFQEEGVLRECILLEGEYQSLIVMSLLAEEYYGSNPF